MLGGDVGWHTRARVGRLEFFEGFSVGWLCTSRTVLLFFASKPCLSVDWSLVLFVLARTGQLCSLFGILCTFSWMVSFLLNSAVLALSCALCDPLSCFSELSCFCLGALPTKGVKQQRSSNLGNIDLWRRLLVYLCRFSYYSYFLYAKRGTRKRLLQPVDCCVC